MSTASTTFRFRDSDTAELFDPLEVEASNRAATAGVIRLDTAEVVVAAGTALTRDSEGVYTLSWTEPEPALTYRVYLHWSVGPVAEDHYYIRDVAGTGTNIAGRDNLLHGPLQGLVELLAASATFRDLVGATGDTESELSASAAMHIHEAAIQLADSLSDDERNSAIINARPCAVVDLGEDFQAQRVATGGGFYPSSGSLVLQIEANVPAASTDHDDCRRWFGELVGNILSDMLSKANTQDYLTIASIANMTGPWRSDELDAQHLGDFCFQALAINWSI
jgi:hypothetical protein